MLAIVLVIEKRAETTDFMSVVFNVSLQFAASSGARRAMASCCPQLG